MWPLAVSMDGSRCLLIRSIVEFGHVEKYPFLIYWRVVLLTVLKSVVCYHGVISDLVQYSIRLFYD